MVTERSRSLWALIVWAAESMSVSTCGLLGIVLNSCLSETESVSFFVRFIGAEIRD